MLDISLSWLSNLSRPTCGNLLGKLASKHPSGECNNYEQGFSNTFNPCNNCIYCTYKSTLL